jgi:hypothetical protein
VNDAEIQKVQRNAEAEHRANVIKPSIPPRWQTQEDLMEWLGSIELYQYKVVFEFHEVEPLDFRRCSSVDDLKRYLLEALEVEPWAADRMMLSLDKMAAKGVSIDYINQDARNRWKQAIGKQKQLNNCVKAMHAPREKYSRYGIYREKTQPGDYFDYMDFLSPEARSTVQYRTKARIKATSNRDLVRQRSEAWKKAAEDQSLKKKPTF